MARGTESSAGFGDAVFAWGGLWLAVLPDENLDEILENQEPLLCGAEGVRFSSELVLDKGGRGAAALSDTSVWLLLVAAWGIGEVGGGEAMADVESRAVWESDLLRTAVLMALSAISENQKLAHGVFATTLDKTCSSLGAISSAKV